MSIFKKFAVTGVAVAMMSAAVMADVEVTPYGSVQYRLRFQQSNLTNEIVDPTATATDGIREDEISVFDYSNRLSWRTGLRVKYDDQLSLQFQIGNDWGAAENVRWEANNTPNARVRADDLQNIYAHLAFARWNPGFMFVEAGIVPINSNGTLDMFYSRQNTSDAGGHYSLAGFNGWSDANNSMIGLKIGAPILQDDFKLGVELFQSVLNPRSHLSGSRYNSSLTERGVDDNPQAEEVITVLTIPMQAGDLRITPEVSLIWNRMIDGDDSDMEMLFGLSASYKVSDAISVNAVGAYGMISDENTKATGDPTTTLSGFFVGAGASIKAGPGTLQLAVNHASSTLDVDVDGFEAPTLGYTYGDIRYAIKLHDRVTFTPRYRLYHYGYPEAKFGWTYEDRNDVEGISTSRLDHRFELIFDASF